METLKCIEERRTIRCFQKELISINEIRDLIQSAILAPSACNKQAWKFILVNDSELIKKLALRGSSVIAKAPQGILVLYRNDISYNGYMYKDYIQSAAAAIQNILLTATEKNIATCWICDLNRPSRVRKIFDIPANFDIIAYIALGYPQIDDSTLTLKHYGNIKNKNNHIRKYSIDQVLCDNKFMTFPGDCTTEKPLAGVLWKGRFLKYKFTLNRFFENRF